MEFKDFYLENFRGFPMSGVPAKPSGGKETDRAKYLATFSGSPYYVPMSDLMSLAKYPDSEDLMDRVFSKNAHAGKLIRHFLRTGTIDPDRTENQPTWDNGDYGYWGR